MVCSNCGVENLPGAKFCHECGTPAHSCVPELRLCRSCRCEVLQRMRRHARGRRRPTGTDGPAVRPGEHDAGFADRQLSGLGGADAHRAASRVGPVLRPGRLHAACRGPGPRGGARAPHRLLRPRPWHRRSLRRRGREVHRRCGHGGLGRARGARRTTPNGRSGPGSSSCPRSPSYGSELAHFELAARVGVVTGPGGHDRDPRGGLCRRRPGQHSGEDPGRRAGGVLLCGRGDETERPMPPSCTTTPAPTS